MLALLAGALLSLSGCASAREQVRDANPALWAVRDADTTIYIFGTIHVLPREIDWFNDEVKLAFDRSNELVMEMVTPSAEEMTALVQQTAFTPGQPPLTKLLTGEDRKRFIAAQKQLRLSGIERFEPWMAAIQISVAHVTSLGFEADLGPEEVLTRAAVARGMPQSGLETAAQQFAVFDNLPLEAQTRYLASTLEELPNERKSFTDLIAAWEKGDTASIADQMKDSAELSPDLKQKLLIDRNTAWANWVKARMARPGVVFMAVGVGHLSGPDNVLDMLGKRGLVVRRVSMDDFVTP